MLRFFSNPLAPQPLEEPLGSPEEQAFRQLLSKITRVASQAATRGETPLEARIVEQTSHEARAIAMNQNEPVANYQDLTVQQIAELSALDIYKNIRLYPQEDGDRPVQQRQGVCVNSDHNNIVSQYQKRWKNYTANLSMIFVVGIVSSVCVSDSEESHELKQGLFWSSVSIGVLMVGALIRAGIAPSVTNEILAAIDEFKAEMQLLEPRDEELARVDVAEEDTTTATHV